MKGIQKAGMSRCFVQLTPTWLKVYLKTPKMPLARDQKCNIELVWDCKFELEVLDRKTMVTFPVVGDEDGAIFVLWTTTPWTLLSNLALCVDSNFVYVKVRFRYVSKNG
ncbi:hypothetical protein L1887_07728 [Cichorium endivia]|nr:hypothetical protein L1887_07728 [Cichorium endivia]